MRFGVLRVRALPPMLQRGSGWCGALQHDGGWSLRPGVPSAGDKWNGELLGKVIVLGDFVAARAQDRRFCAACLGRAGLES